jgi:hypothetical protein
MKQAGEIVGSMALRASLSSFYGMFAFPKFQEFGAAIESARYLIENMSNCDTAMTNDELLAHCQGKLGCRRVLALRGGEITAVEPIRRSRADAPILVDWDGASPDIGPALAALAKTPGASVVVLARRYYNFPRWNAADAPFALLNRCVAEHGLAKTYVALTQIDTGVAMRITSAPA